MAPEDPPDSSWSLPPDTEFLFNEECVLSKGTLALPRVCILTGERHGLVAMNTIFSAIPEGYRKAFALLIVVSVLSFPVSSLADSMVTAETWMILPGILAGVAPLVIIAGICRRHRLDLRWYVEKNAIGSIESEWRRWRLTRAAGGLLLLLIAVAFRILVALTAAIILILPGTIIGMGSRRNLLKAPGTYHDLLIVKRFKPAFFAELKRLSQRENSKTV